MKDVYNILDKYKSTFSDIIIRRGDVYRNLTTGVGSVSMQDVLSGRRYIYIDNDYYGGLFAICEGSCLYLYGLYLNEYKCRWDISCIFMVRREESGYGFHIEKNGSGDISIYTTDVCGQFCPKTANNKDGRSVLEMLHFFGTSYWCAGGNYINVMLYGIQNDVDGFGIVNPHGIRDMDADKRESALHDAREFFETDDGKKILYSFGRIQFCVIDYEDDSAVFRVFECFPLFDESGVADDMEFFEYRRFVYDDAECMSVKTLDIPMLWADERAKSCFRGFTSIGESLAVLILCERESLLECVYKYSHDMWKDFFLSARTFFVDGAVKGVYGDVSDTGRLHQMLGIPKPMLSMFPSPDIIKAVKRIFKSCPEYLMNMDEESCSFIMNTFIRNKLYMKGVLIKSACLLVSMYGPRNYRKYIEYLNDLPTSVLVEIPYYYEKLSDMDPDCRKYFKWDIRSESTGDDMLVYIQSLNYLIDGINGAGVTHCTKMFEKRQEEWGMYSFHQNGFTIKYPHSVMDLFMEGSALHHCVPSFLSACAEGKTTILFIRKESEPEKPYFTLEIRDGEIRQCHGFANTNICNVPEKSDLISFLQEFCDSKGIVFSMGNTGLRV